MSFSAERVIPRLAAAFLALVGLVALFTWGVHTGKAKEWPYPVFNAVLQQYGAALEQLGEAGARTGIDAGTLPLFYKRLPKGIPQNIHEPQRSWQGINLVTRIARNSEMAVDVMSMDGEVIHTWNVDWFEVWPDAEHLPELLVPKSKPGTHIHGAVVLEDGDLVFNYEHLGLVRLSRSSEVIWKLPYRTHHSVHLHDDGMLWVSGQRRSEKRDPRFPYREPPFDSYTLLEIDPADGTIIDEIEVADILYENGYGNLMLMVPVKPNPIAPVLDDRLHLNDVEPFPNHMQPGFFGPGDILVSLRNPSTVFVFNRESRKIKYITTGVFSQQHDPDFLDGNRFSTFDNNTRPYKRGVSLSSRIVVIDASTNEMDIVFQGSADQRFYTPFMGKHQWLPNGNILVSESLFGRAFEVDHDGNIVWQWVNRVGDDLVALVEEVSRLPSAYAGFDGAPTDTVPDG